MTKPKSSDLDSLGKNNPRPKKAKSFPYSKFFYETKSRGFLFQNSNGDWIEHGSREFCRYLGVTYGISLKRSDGAPSPAERIITELQETPDRVVNVALELAGHHGPKVIRHADTAILVKHGPKLLEPAEGDYPTLIQYFDGMLPGEQGEHLNCWSAQAVQDAYNGELTTSIIPILCGPHSCGKSLFQHILTEALGGRSSSPYMVMTGGSSFNEHLFGAEHLMIEDEYSSGDYRSRQQLGTALKNFVANQKKLNHGKGKCAFLMPRLFQRLTVSLNDELENIAQLPQKHPSLDHKLSLYACQHAPMPMPTRTEAERKVFWAQLMKELPAWIFDLLYKTTIPDRWLDGRFMVAYRHDKISDALDELQPEIKLRELVRAVYWADFPLDYIEIGSGQDQIWRNPTQFEADLRHQSSPVRSLADDLLRSPAATGRYFTRLCERFPEEFSSKRTKRERLYGLFRPAMTDDSKVTV